jgi:hypothetical protein
VLDITTIKMPPTPAIARLRAYEDLADFVNTNKQVAKATKVMDEKLRKNVFVAYAHRTPAFTEAPQLSFEEQAAQVFDSLATEDKYNTDLMSKSKAEIVTAVLKAMEAKQKGTNRENAKKRRIAKATMQITAAQPLLPPTPALLQIMPAPLLIPANPTPVPDTELINCAGPGGLPCNTVAESTSCEGIPAHPSPKRSRATPSTKQFRSTSSPTHQRPATKRSRTIAIKTAIARIKGKGKKAVMQPAASPAKSPCKIARTARGRVSLTPQRINL